MVAAEGAASDVKKWSPRFRLRSLLVLVTLLSLVLGGWFTQVQPYRAQHLALTQIRSLDGGVLVRKAEGPAWQRYLVQTFVAPEAFVEAHHITMHADQIPGAMQTTLARLPFVEHLKLDSSGVDDRMVAALPADAPLVSLSVRGTDISDRSLAKLARLRHLSNLQLESTGVTDEGLEWLERSRSLDQLWLRWTKVTPEGVERFREAHPECAVVTYFD